MGKLEVMNVLVQFLVVIKNLQFREGQEEDWNEFFFISIVSCLMGFSF